MDRREFLKTSGLAAAAATVAACAPKALNNNEATAPSDEVFETGTMPQHYPGVGLLGYGCMRWPMTTNAEGKSVINQEEVNRLVEFAMSQGVNYFDTAPVYLQGDSERATAQALSPYPRDKYILATKLSNFSDWTYDNSVMMFRKSLEYFNTDYVDYYLLHNLSGGQAFRTRCESTGIMDFLLKERELGHIRNLGFSFHGSTSGFDEMLALHEKYHWDFVQIQMNYSDWKGSSNAEYQYNELAKRDIPVVIMEPLLGGGLASMPAALSDRLKAIEPQKSIASWAFRFAGSFPKVLTVLSGMTYMDHLKDNLRTFLDFKPVSEEEQELLFELAELKKNYPLVACTACQYCMPCPYGINIPAIFKFYNDSVNEGTYVSSKEQKDYARARRKYLAKYNKDIPTVRQADHCISCNRCVEHCPQRIRIPRELRRIDQYIESLKQETI